MALPVEAGDGLQALVEGLGLGVEVVEAGGGDGSAVGLSERILVLVAGRAGGPFGLARLVEHGARGGQGAKGLSQRAGIGQGALELIECGGPGGELVVGGSAQREPVGDLLQGALDLGQLAAAPM